MKTITKLMILVNLQCILCLSSFGQFRNCSEILANNPSSPSGIYNIDPDQSGPLPTMDCYCDMVTDGGGWTLVLNYLHLNGTNPQLHIFTDSLPIQNSVVLGSDESNTKYWGNADTVIMNALNFNLVRFYAITSAHSRVINFKTDHNPTIDYFKSGVGDMMGITSNFTPYPNHTANLPAATNNYQQNYGNYAMTYAPYFTTSTYHWYLGPNDNSRWEVDDFTFSMPSTFHQIWVKDTLLTVNINKNTMDSYFNLYPNPTKGEVFLTSNNKIERLEVFNLVGEKVMEKEVGSNSSKFNMEDLMKGIYLVKIFYEGEIKVSKLILD